MRHDDCVRMKTSKKVNSSRVSHVHLMAIKSCRVDNETTSFPLGYFSRIVKSSSRPVTLTYFWTRRSRRCRTHVAALRPPSSTSVKISPGRADCSTKRRDCRASKCESCRPRSIDPERGEQRERMSAKAAKHEAQISVIKTHKTEQSIKRRERIHS